MASQNSLTLTIGAHSYYIHKSPKATLPPRLTRQLYGEDLEYIPTTAIEWTQNTFSRHDLEDTCRCYEETDDVWSRDFLWRKLFSVSCDIMPSKIYIVLVLLQPPQIKYLKHGKRIFSINKDRSKLPPGPYIIERKTGHIFAVYRLYTDTYRAFLNGVIHGNGSRISFHTIATSSDNIAEDACIEDDDKEDTVTVPVPSRLYFKQSQKLPLAGVSA
jgi:hypothetical protein